MFESHIGFLYSFCISPSLFPLQREHGLLCLERVDPDWASWSKIIQDWDAEVSFTVFHFPATIAFMIYSTPKRQSQSRQIISKPSTISFYNQIFLIKWCPLNPDQNANFMKFRLATSYIHHLTVQVNWVKLLDWYLMCFFQVWSDFIFMKRKTIFTMSHFISLPTSAWRRSWRWSHSLPPSPFPQPRCCWYI